MNNIIKNCDFNRRLDLYLHNFQNIRRENVKRFFNVAFPFINLYKPAQKFSSIGLGIYQTGLISSKLLENYKNKDWKSFSNHFNQLCLLVCSAAFNIFFPSASIVVTSSFQILSSTYRMCLHLKNCEFKLAFEQSKNIAHQVIYISASLFATPELLLISLLGQAAVEIKNAVKEIKNGKNLEAFGNLLMALIRIRQAVPHAVTIHRNEFGKQLTQEDFNKILNEIKKQQEVNKDHVVVFEKILADQYYSSKVRNISFTQENKRLTNIFFNDISFQGCNFDSVEMLKTTFHNVKVVDSSFKYCNLTSVFMNNVRFSNTNLFGSTALNSIFKNNSFTYCDIDRGLFLNSILNQCSFTNCDLDSSEFSYSILQNTSYLNSRLDDSAFFKTILDHSSFNNCSMVDSNFARSKLETVSFKDSDLSYGSFYEANMSNVKFSSAKLFETNFFNAYVKKGKIINSDLTDCLLIGYEGRFTIKGGTPHRITRPIIGMNWSHEIGGAAYANLINRCMRTSDSIILKYDHDLENIDWNKLDNEIYNDLHRINLQGLDKESLSIADEILKKAAKESEIEKIKLKVEKISKYTHGMIIPGGNDVEPEFYGHQRSESTHTESNCGRSLFEFALISQAQAKSIPLQGICRGSQMVNIFNGGTLKQHVDNHFSVIHDLKINQNMDSKSAEIIRGIIKGNQINGLSMHHQANDKIGKGLFVVIDQEGVPKALASENGKIILTQFHPEISIYDGVYYPENTFKNNNGFFEYLAQQSRKYFEETKIQNSIFFNSNRYGVRT